MRLHVASLNSLPHFDFLPLLKLGDFIKMFYLKVEGVLLFSYRKLQLFTLQISPVVKLWQWGTAGGKEGWLDISLFCWRSLGPRIYSNYYSGNELCRYNETAPRLSCTTWFSWFLCFGLLYSSLSECLREPNQTVALTYVQIQTNGRPEPQDRSSFLHPL